MCQMKSVFLCGWNIGYKEDDDTANTISSSTNVSDIETEGTGSAI